MKVLKITNGYPSTEEPSLYVFFHEHAKVVSMLAEVKVQTLLRGKRFAYRRYVWEGISVEALEMPYRPNMGFLFFPLAVLLHFVLLLKNVVSYKPDVAIAHDALPHGLALIPFKLLGLRFIVVKHSLKTILRSTKLAKLVLKCADGVYAVSSFLKENIESLLGVHVHGILPNPVHANYREECNRINKRIVFVGRWDDNKSPELIIQTAELLESINFVLVGLECKDVLPNVRCVGKLPRQKVLEIMCRSDMLVSVSKHETFGMSIAEALALGKPVVWTDSGGPRDFLNERNSILVEERTPQAIARAIEQAYRKLSEGFFIPEEIRKSILEYAGYERVMDIYRKALDFDA